MRHIGIDLGQRSCFMHGLDDETGEVFLDEELPSEREAIIACLAACQGAAPTRIVLEACGLAGYWVDVLEPLGEVVAVHPKHVRAIQPHRRKTDRRDAQFLATLSRVDTLPRSYLGTTAERDLKDLLRHRVALVRIQTRLRVRLRNVTQRYGVVLAAETVDSPKARQLWQALPLRPTHRLIVDQLLAALAALEPEVTAVEQQILGQARLNPNAQLLDTLPGLDYFGALLVAAEIGDVKRFHSSEALACFAGLVPSEHSSGSRERRGKITKEGSGYLRWMMVQAAIHYRKSPRLTRLYERVLHRRGPMKARVAVARELLEIAWHMLRQQRPYEERGPQEGRRTRTDSGKPVDPLTP